MRALRLALVSIALAGATQLCGQHASAAGNVSISDVAVDEGNAGLTVATFTITRDSASATDTTIDYMTVDGTATLADNDYVQAENNVTIPASAGPDSTTIQIDIVGDTDEEPDETFVVQLTSASDATIADGMGEATIVNDDAATTPNVSISDIAVDEGNSGLTVATFTITRDSASATDTTIDYMTVDGTATLADNDYVQAVDNITIPASPGPDSGTIQIEIVGDTDEEPDENFVVELTSASNANIADGIGEATIVNDDAATTPSVSISDIAVDEGNSGVTVATFTVLRDGASPSDTVVGFNTADFTAIAGADYQPAEGQVIVPASAGPGTATIPVNVVGDEDVESDEAFLVDLISAPGAVIVDGQGVGTVVNDDEPEAPIDDAADITPLPAPVVDAPVADAPVADAPVAAPAPAAATTPPPTANDRARTTTPAPQTSPVPEATPSAPLPEQPVSNFAEAQPRSLTATTSDGLGNGRPGVGLDLRGAGWTDCENVYFFFNGVRIGSSEPDAEGRVHASGRSVPGGAVPGRGAVTAGCDASGTPSASTWFTVRDASSHRSAFVTSFNKPFDVSWSVEGVVVAVGIALLLTLLLAFATELFNSTFEENEEEVRGWFKRRDRPGEPGRTRRGVSYVALVVFGGALCAFISPDAGIDLATLALVTGMSMALVMVTVGFGVPHTWAMRRRFGARGRIKALPASVIIAAVCVIGSRAVDFEPGILYGLLASVVFDRELDDVLEGKLFAIASGGILAASLVAWLVSEPLAHAAKSSGSFLLFVSEATIAAVCLIGLETLAFVLIPLRFFVGPAILGWNKIVWLVLMVASFAMYITILVQPGLGYVGPSSSLSISIVVFIAIPVTGSVLFWSYFRFRPERSVPDREPALRVLTEFDVVRVPDASPRVVHTASVGEKRWTFTPGDVSRPC